jgi:hypothetical protein
MKMMPKMPGSYGQVPGGNQFQFFPVQVGGPTPYARSRKFLFVGVSIYQLLMGVMALIEFANFLSGFVMLIASVAAFMAFKEDLNITYVCWFGLLSFVGFLVGMVAAFIGFSVKISTIIIKFNIPVSCFICMLVAWWLYSDYESEHPEASDMVASWLRAFGMLKPKPPPEATGSFASMMSGANLPQFGNAQFDSIKGQAAAYGAMGQQSFSQFQQQTADQEKGFMKTVFGGGAPAFAEPAGGPPDLKRDPFLTS